MVARLASTSVPLITTSVSRPGIDPVASPCMSCPLRAPPPSGADREGALVAVGVARASADLPLQAAHPAVQPVPAERRARLACAPWGPAAPPWSSGPLAPVEPGSPWDPCSRPGIKCLASNEESWISLLITVPRRMSLPRTLLFRTSALATLLSSICSPVIVIAAVELPERDEDRHGRHHVGIAQPSGWSRKHLVPPLGAEARSRTSRLSVGCAGSQRFGRST